MARRTFHGTAAYEGVQTGDGRVIGDGALRWDGAQWPLQLATEDWGGHQGAIVAGTITSYTRGPDGIAYEGFLDDETTGGRQVAELADSGAPLAPSVDLDDVTVDIYARTSEEDDMLMLLASAQPLGRLHADQYSFRLGARLTAEPRRARSLAAAAGDPDPTDSDDMVLVYSYSSDEVIERTASARLRGQTLVSYPAFADTTFVLDPPGSADADTDAGEAASEQPEPVAAAAATPCTDCGGSSGTTVAASTEAMPDTLVREIEQALSGVVEPPMYPPAAWFADPQLTELTPVTITPEGRVYGHIAPWGQCHTGSTEGACILTPHSSPGLPYFNTGALVTREGGQVTVGQLTVGGGHADISLSYRGAVAHYDDVATAWADVHAGEDRHGVWVNGAVRPGLTELQVRAIRAASVSGDWRGVGYSSELCAIHCVNVPGFPIARVAAGTVQAVVAAGAMAMAELGHAVDHGLAAEVAALRRQFAALNAEVTGPHRRRLQAAGTAAARARLRAADPRRAAAVERLRG